MDWKKTFSYGQWIIHAIFAVSIIACLGSTLFALRLNNLQSTEEERGLKVNSLIHHLKKDQSFDKIGKYLSWAESTKANDKMNELKIKIAETEDLLEMKASSELSLNMRTFNKLINSNSGMSDPADALKVLKNKISGLQEYASSRKYRNVSIIAERMFERMDELSPKNVGNSIQVSYLKSDIKRLEQLVGTSALDQGDKTALNSRFESMNNELGLLGSLNNQARDLKAHVNQATIALSQWMLDVEKKAGDIHGLRLGKQNQLVIMLASIVGFLVLSWMGLAYLFRWQKVVIAGQVENEVKTVIEKGIISDQRFMMDHYSDHTRNDIVHLLDGLKIKLNLGAMLHDGLPFAGCMIDNTFKLTWYNHLFLEQFYLSDEEVRSDAFNWDYLREYLNLDEDPIYQALVNRIAGIYPVKIKQDELAPAQPYEMYVTPINANREDRVMVFFYPLVSVKEAIDEQVNMSRTALSQFITKWNEERLSDDEIRLIEKDFKNNDLMDLYDELVSLYTRLNDEKTEYLHVINGLEKDNDNYSRSMKNIHNIEEEKKTIIREEVKIASSLRDSFIKAIEKGESLIQINKTIMQQNDDLKNSAQRMVNISQEMAKKNKETGEILGQLEGVKTDYKKLKYELLEVKAKLISVNNSLFGQLPALDESQQKLASRYKDELARLDFNVTTMDKKLSQLDVLLGKMQMMHEKSPIEQTNFNFQTSQKEHELRETLIEIQKALSNEETKIVDQFKSLHSLMKKDMHTVHSSQELSSDNSEMSLS